MNLDQRITKWIAATFILGGLATACGLLSWFGILSKLGVSKSVGAVIACVLGIMTWVAGSIYWVLADRREAERRKRESLL